MIELDEVFDRKSIKRDGAVRQLQSAEGSRMGAFLCYRPDTVWKMRETHLLSQQLLLIQQVVTSVALHLMSTMKNL